MRYLPISKLTSGMALGQDIYDGSGRLLLAKHLILNREYIANLELLGFPGIYIDDAFTQGIEIQQVLSPQVRSQALRVIHEIYMADETLLQPIVSRAEIMAIVERVVENILSNGDVMCNMMDIKNYDDYVFYHSINVMMLSVMIGIHDGMSEDKLNLLATAAMLHDIGQKFIDADILKADRPLTEEERETVAQHPKLGYEYLHDNYDFSSLVYTSVLQHHEWYNGEGYPLRKSGEEIPIFARIIRVADSYDAMVSKRPSREPMLPGDAVEYMMARCGMEFDPYLLNLFLQQIAVYPVGCEVELSNGERAVVMENFKCFTLRPLVKLEETGELLHLRDDPMARSITITKLIVD